MLRILTGGVHSSVTQQKTIRALEMFKSLTCGAHMPASLFLNESVWYRWIKIQRPTFVHVSGERRRPKPSGATAPATARGTDGSPRGSGDGGEGAGGVRRFGEAPGRSCTGWGGSWRRRREAPLPRTGTNSGEQFGGVPGQKKDGCVRVWQR